MATLNADRFELEDVETLPASDDRRLSFTVQDGDGEAVDLSEATVEWYLMDRAWDVDADDALLTGESDGVSIATDTVVDPEAGEFRVDIDGEATADLAGEYWQFPRVVQSGPTTSTWRGAVLVEAI